MHYYHVNLSLLRAQTWACEYWMFFVALALRKCYAVYPTYNSLIVIRCWGCKFDKLVSQNQAGKPNDWMLLIERYYKKIASHVLLNLWHRFCLQCKIMWLKKINQPTVSYFHRHCSLSFKERTNLLFILTYTSLPAIKNIKLIYYKNFNGQSKNVKTAGSYWVQALLTSFFNEMVGFFQQN